MLLLALVVFIYLLATYYLLPVIPCNIFAFSTLETVLPLPVLLTSEGPSFETKRMTHFAVRFYEHSR